MGGINLNESGLDFVRQVFVTFGGNTTVLTLFLLSVLYLALKGKKEERYVFVTTAVFLAFTVYNPFAVKYILGKLGMVNVYYRFFWILPMVLTIGYACTKVVGGQKKGWRRYLTAAALAAVICFGGNSVLAGGLPKLPDNQYKMPDDPVRSAMRGRPAPQVLHRGTPASACGKAQGLRRYPAGSGGWKALQSGGRQHPSG